MLFQAGGRLTARYLASTLRISLRSVQLSRYTGAGVLASDISVKHLRVTRPQSQVGFWQTMA